MDIDSSGTPVESPAVLILCGGQSSRMGEPKAFVDVGGVRLIERVIHTACRISRQVFLVTPRPEDYRRFGLPLVTNEEPGRGPLAALCAGLAACGTSSAWALACDLPNLSAPPLLAMKAHLVPGVDAVVPRSSRGAEPLCALYKKECAPIFEKALGSGTLALHKALESLQVAHPSAQDIGAPADFFANLNTPAEIQDWRG